MAFEERGLITLNETLLYYLIAVFALIFVTYLHKATFRKFVYLFKQILSYFSLVRIKFYLSQASGKWVRAKTVIAEQFCVAFVQWFTPKQKGAFNRCLTSVRYMYTKDTCQSKGAFKRRLT